MPHGAQVNDEPDLGWLDPLDVLRRGVASYVPWLRASGELDDPVFRRPTQYSTPYYALANAVLAARSDGTERETCRDRAWAGLGAALEDLLDLDRPPTASGFDRGTGAAAHSNHRDFYWPPVLKTYRLLRELGTPGIEEAARRIEAVDIERAFSARPPSNWAAVWVSGEWMRMREGLSALPVHALDAWLEPFFEQRILLEQGMYQEPGHPNSYDLFTRWHLADLLAEGYSGRWRPELEELMISGLRRSLGVQLSDGSLASAHRSTGQTWTVGAQCAYFTLAARHADRLDPTLAGRAREAAKLAFTSFARWQRPGGVFSPVENLLPPGWRVGYERYTADAHYGSLALAFLALAVLAGFNRPVRLPLPDRAPGVFIEGDPPWRAIAHNGAMSVHVNARPHPAYDAFGIVDVTFGPARYFHLVSSARCADGSHRNIGLEGADDLTLLRPIERDGSPSGLMVEARRLGAAHRHRIRASVDRRQLWVEESTPGLSSPKALLVPYLRDAGTGHTTSIDAAPGEVRFRLGSEVVALGVEGEIERVIDLPHGYESRRGLCGLLRVELRGRREGIGYRLTIDR